MEQEEVMEEEESIGMKEEEEEDMSWGEQDMSPGGLASSTLISAN